MQTLAKQAQRFRNSCGAIALFLSSERQIAVAPLSLIGVQAVASTEIAASF